MHQSSIENMQHCYSKYIKNDFYRAKDKVSVVDIGGANVNGSYKDIFSAPMFNYIAVDIEENDNVDVVLEDPYKLPFESNSIDILITGQAFEHVEFFWLLFEEFARVISENGIIILIAPSSGPIHRFPVDCYRFYPDAYSALAKYTHLNAVEIIHDNRGPWNDLVGVFCKGEYQSHPKTIPWPNNSYEVETSPTVEFKSNNDETEKLVGQTPYLDVLKYFHENTKPNKYLEIGVRKGNSLKLAHCETVAIDPYPDLNFNLNENTKIYTLTSDEFFIEQAPKVLNNKVDLSFIDGMHLFEFVLRDFINVEKYSDKSSTIIIDDVLPNHPIQASRIRKSAAWTGDVWKIYYCLKEYRPDLKLTLLDTYPTGLLIIQNLNFNNKVLLNNYNPIVRKYKNLVMSDEQENDILNRKISQPWWG